MLASRTAQCAHRNPPCSIRRQGPAVPTTQPTALRVSTHAAALYSLLKSPHQHLSANIPFPFSTHPILSSEVPSRLASTVQGQDLGRPSRGQTQLPKDIIRHQ